MNTVLRIKARRLDHAGREDARVELRIEDDRPVSVGASEECLLRVVGAGPFRSAARTVVFDAASSTRRLLPWSVTEGFVSHGFFGAPIDVCGSASPILLSRPPMHGQVVVGPWHIQFVLAPRMDPCMRCRSAERRRAFCLECGRDLGEPTPPAPGGT